jgi:CRISPR/Cas system-associated exonuclease Cas4 (RecB family)
VKHLSPSQIAMFKKCPKQWYFAYVLNMRRPPSGAQHLGSSAHKSFEAHNKFKVKTQNDLPVDELQDRYSDAFKSVARSEIQWEDESPDKVYDDGSKIVTLFSVTAGPRIQPLLVEQRIEIPIEPLEGGESVPNLVTVLDLVDDQQKVHDYKTKGKTAPGGEADNSDQLTAYSLAHKFKFGHLPSALALDIFVRPMKTKPAGFYEEQATTRGDEQVEIYKQDVRAVASTISHSTKTGLFPYAPMDSWACSEKFCGFFAICPGGAARRVSFAPIAEAPIVWETKPSGVSALGTTQKSGEPVAEEPAEAKP